MTMISTEKTPSKPKMLTLKEASAMIEGISESTIRKFCISGALKHIKAGNKYLISEKNLLDFFDC